MPDESFEELWDSAPRASRHFDPTTIAHLPEAARRYLEHTLAPGAPLSTAVRLRMHGEIKVGGIGRTSRPTRSCAGIAATCGVPALA